MGPLIPPSSEEAREAHRRELGDVSGSGVHETAGGYRESTPPRDDEPEGELAQASELRATAAEHRAEADRLEARALELDPRREGEANPDPLEGDPYAHLRKKDEEARLAGTHTADDEPEEVDE